MRGLWLAALPPTLLVLVVSLAAPLGAEAPRRPARGASATAAVPVIHRVKAGDTLIGIASRHHVTVAALVATNRLAGADARVRVGQRLVIPGASPALVRARRTPPLVPARRLLSPPPALVLAVPDFSDLAPLFVWPVDGPVSSMFGRRRMGWHRGIDIKADLGALVTASAGGTVVTSAYETRYGRVVKIEHFNGFMTVYAHNDENLVEAGDRVSLGQAIALVGRTGRATADHLHFEIRQAGLAYNPLYMLPLPPRPTLVEETNEEDHDDADE